MISGTLVVGAMVIYMLLLFGIAHYADRQRHAGRSIVSNPYVYALSLGVYCSAWTFYGSIGRAAQTGLGFLPVYLGPSLAMLLGWLMIRKIVRISKEYRLTSISDFICFRYGRSYSLGLLVTLVSVMVITPYVALQLIAISSSIEILSGKGALPLEGKLLIAGLLAIFCIMFGARHLDPLERHEGLIAAVAFESIVKLLAFLAVGIYITWGLFPGYSDLIQNVLDNPQYSHLINIDYPSWFSITLISFFAIILLPRQFHIMVVENSSESHLKKAMWIFPLYLLLINLFVPAIAGAGLILGIPGVQDMFIISIPFTNQEFFLAVLVFIGGASAATAMVMVDSVAVGTMLLNELEMPYLMRYLGKGRDLPGLLLNMKRLNIILVVALGYAYSLAVEYSSLADIGILSFLAASQMAPAAVGGLYWRRGNRIAAIAGMVTGFLLWIYTALVPVLAKAHWIGSDLVESGPLGISMLRPTALLGVELDPWSHSVFWTLFVNGTLYVLISLVSKPTEEEQLQAHGFVDIYEEKVSRPAERRSIRIGTVEELESTLSRYVGPDRAKEVVETYLQRMNTTREDIDASQLLELWDRSEKVLTGSLGPSATKMIVDKVVEVTPVLERPLSTQPSYVLEAGRILVVPLKAYEVFVDQVTHGIEGLCITTSDPEEIRDRLGITETPIIRLSHSKGVNERYITPTNLPLLFLTIKAFVESSKNSVILLDNMEFLVEENAGLVPESEVLDFVNQLEHLCHQNRTRLILDDDQSFVHLPLKQDINPVEGLIFNLGPFPSYLFKLFVTEMLKAAKATSELVREVNSLIASRELFTGSWSEASDEAASCDPDMKFDGRPDLEISVDPDLRMTRRQFFGSLRRISRVIARRVYGFSAALSLAKLMDQFKFSRYELILTPGTTYVVEEDKPVKSMEIFSELIHLGADGLCVSRYNPEILGERYGIDPQKVIWLTQRGEEGRYRTVDPANLPRLSSMISDFLRQSSYPVILIEGLGYLMTQSNYETVLRFIQSQRDDIALKDAILLVHIDPLTLDTKELHRLEGEMEPLESILQNRSK